MVSFPVLSLRMARVSPTCGTGGRLAALVVGATSPSAVICGGSAVNVVYLHAV